METNALLVEPHADGTITLHASSQGVHTVRDAIARAGGFRISDGFISPLDLISIGMVSALEAEELHEMEQGGVPAAH